jgi:PAS domain S-box-containing protein
LKIQLRLMSVIIPVLIIVHGVTALFTNIMSTSALEDQTRENANLLSNSYSLQINSRIDQYQNISRDLASAVITSINIERTLQEVRKRYPQFTHVFYTPANGQILDLSPYQSELVGFNLKEMASWQRAYDNKQPTLSEPGEYFGQKSLIFYAPALLSYVQNQIPTVEGMVALVLPLENLFEGIGHSTKDNSLSVFVSDSRGILIHHDDPEMILFGSISSLSSTQSLDSVTQSMVEQKTGFATYSDRDGRKFISFSPIPSARWSLGVTSTYGDITSEITRITLINMIIVFVGILISVIIVYFVVHTVVHPIEILTSLTQKIAMGDRTILTTLETSSEIGQLSESINSMVLELRNSQEKLEAIVEERTMELKVTNEELEQTVEELNAANASLGNTRDNLEQMVEERTGQLQKAQNYISNIINSMPSILIGINKEGIITQWNHEAEHQMNLSSDEAINQSIEHVIPHMTSLMDPVFETMKSKKEYKMLKNKRLKGGKAIFEDVTVFPLIANGVDGAVIRVDDVTDRVMLEESFRQSQKMDAIGQLAGE